MKAPEAWVTEGYGDLELSTQLFIKEALARGHSVEVLDRADNFIRIVGNGKVEYVKQATRTSADSYIAPLIMESKKVTKLVLAEAGLRVPAGRDYTDYEAFIADLEYWRSRGACVVKPNSTNFGVAVSILAAPLEDEAYAAAGRAAFERDGSVLVEEFLPGKEYRFLVIDGQTVAVLHRVPANVVGDGAASIADLVARKNADPRRGEGYTAPLERIRLGDEELRFLAGQGLSPASVPGLGETVLLRKNSNISTGGDSLDYTDAMHPLYKDLAAASAAAVGAKICGVDMIVPDTSVEPTGDNYGIIELNFNPALHIHDFPYAGENRRVETYVLNLLGL